jgi:hypothetical protein
VPSAEVPETVATGDITILDELAELAPPLTPSEYQHLGTSIREHGIRNPLIVSRRVEHLVLLDGHNRLRIAKKLGMEQVPIHRESLSVDVWRGKKRHTIDLSDEPDAGMLDMDYDELWLRKAKLAALRAQLRRRNLTLYSKIAMTWEARREIYCEHPGRVDERLGRDCGVSKHTAQRAMWLLENAPKDYIERLESDEIAIGTAYTELKKPKKEKAEEKAEIPEAKLFNRLPKVMASVVKYDAVTVAGQAKGIGKGERKGRIRNARLNAEWWNCHANTLEADGQREENEESTERAEALEAKASKAADTKAEAEVLISEFKPGTLFSTSEYPSCVVLSARINDSGTPVVEFDAGPNYPRRKEPRYLEEPTVHEQWGSKIIHKQNPNWGKWVEKIWPRQFSPQIDGNGNRNYTIQGVKKDAA